MLENLFKLRENDTDVKTEIIAGFTTFMTMAYIIIVNPMILSGIEGISFEAIFFATIAGAVLGTLCMAFLTNYPFALASGMGLNAFFVAMVTQISNLTWQIALGIILIEGVLFIILSILPVREMIVNAIPISLKSGISAGIGLFIALIGLENAGIIIGTAKVIEEDPELVLEGGIGLTSQLFTGSALIALIGLVIIGVLHAKKVKGSIFVGIIITSVVAWILNGLGWVSLPNMSVGFFEWPNFSEWGTVFFKMDVAGAVKGILDFSLIGVLFAFLFVDMFDT
ncbi:MAG: solute carrier family 23 protein, partial [Halothermotrichaceae bacterium]